MRLLKVLQNFSRNHAKSANMAEEIKKAIVNHSYMLDNKLSQLIEIMKLHTGITEEELSRFYNNGYQAPLNYEAALRVRPLMFADKTFNTGHPDYEASAARNFPNKFFNLDSHLINPVFAELKKLMHKEEIPENIWNLIHKEALEEIKANPHSEEVFQRKAFVENYIKELETNYKAFYKPGWVNLEDALFLYWVVRHLKPKTIVQTGVCNGLSSSFMMLALAKNGPDGTLHVIDLPPVFNSNDNAWKIRGKIYGVTIPEGKTSGWLVPDVYRDRFEVLNGDAKLLLPDLLKKLGKIDMFYHDSDHTYDHMMFEFVEAKNYLTQPSLIVSDDIAWNASLWDFADMHQVPAYNYRGSMGLACF